MITGVETVDLVNIGVIRGKVSNDVLSAIKDEVVEIQNDYSKAVPHNIDLAGHIRKEYLLSKCCDVVEQEAVSLAVEHNKKYNYINTLYTNNTTKKFKFRLESLWVNFQERYEFNPLHRHGGVYSFVVWVDIPYFLNFEQKISPGNKSYTNRSGMFEFVYTDILGRITGESVLADKTYEGNILLFPADLHHMVHPFYSTEKTRISIAGNLELVADNS